MNRHRGLFEDTQEEESLRGFLDIPGLSYAAQFLTPVEQDTTLAEIDGLPWRTDLKRRVQHYGYKYDYKARGIDNSMFVGPLPPFAAEIAQKLVTHKLMTDLPDQLIVNEYQPGQGISAHVDCEPCFGGTIVTISLLSACEMDFIRIASREIRSATLEPGSVLVLRDEGRYQWMHRIKARKTDNGLPRGRRVSLTYRNVILTS